MTYTGNREQESYMKKAGVFTGFLAVSGICLLNLVLAACATTKETVKKENVTKETVKKERANWTYDLTDPIIERKTVINTKKPMKRVPEFSVSNNSLNLQFLRSSYIYDEEISILLRQSDVPRFHAKYLTELDEPTRTFLIKMAEDFAQFIAPESKQAQYSWETIDTDDATVGIKFMFRAQDGRYHEEKMMLKAGTQVVLTVDETDIQAVCGSNSAVAFDEALTQNILKAVKELDSLKKVQVKIPSLNNLSAPLDFSNLAFVTNAVAAAKEQIAAVKNRSPASYEELKSKMPYPFQIAMVNSEAEKAEKSARQKNAVELWNGFTTAMTEEDVMARAKEVLQPEKTEWLDDDRVFGPFGPAHMWRSGLYGLSLDNESSTGWASGRQLRVLSPLPAYSYISFDFHNNFLCGVNVSWAAEFKVLLQQATSQFGKPETFKELYFYSYYLWYRWKIGDKQIYLCNGSDTMSFVYMKPHLEYRAEQEKIRQQQAAEEAERKRKADAGVKF
jgi:hypothetical protein